MFLDIGIGILLSLAFGHVFEIGRSFHWLFFALAASLLPDIDAIFYLIKKLLSKRKIYNHRGFTHYPVVYVPIVAIIYSILGPSYAILFVFCIYSHLIHDSFWLGWGIVWFWPFSTVRFKFFPDRNGKISSQSLMTWSKQQDLEIFEKYNNPHWIRDFYLRPNVVSYTEYSVFIFSLILLFFFL